MSKDFQSNAPSKTVVITIFLAVFVIWLATPFIVKFLYPDMTGRGQFGDLYGSINALFSGLAFAGVIAALLLQQEELRLQRIELSATRDELKRSADAQEKLNTAFRESTYANTFRAVYEVLQDPSTRAARGVVMGQLREIPFAKWSLHENWHQLREQAELVCTTYDTVGMWCAEDKLLPEIYITDSWGNSLQETWDILEPLVQEYRDKRKAPEFWDDFERLAKRAKKLRESRFIPARIALP